MTISIMYKDDVHYTREEVDDPLVQYVAARIAYEINTFGSCNYWIDWGDATPPNNPMQATGLRLSGSDEQTLSSDSSSEHGGNNPPSA